MVKQVAQKILMDALLLSLWNCVFFRSVIVLFIFLISFLWLSVLVRRPSCYSCIRVNTLKSTSDGIIEKLMAILQGTTVKSGHDCKSVGESDATTEVGTSKKLGNFREEPSLDSVSDPNGRLPTGLLRDEDAVEEKSQSSSISKCQLPGLDYVLFVKGSGPHMIEYGDVPNQPLKEVIVSRKCAEAVLRGAQVHTLYLDGNCGFYFKL